MTEVLRETVKSFASLRAAQRALARCMHPARVAAVRESGRQLLIELQALSKLESRGAAAQVALSSLGQERDEVQLERIERLLGHQLGCTLEIVAELDFAQLRAMGPKLCLQYPDEARALIDVMLLGDLESADYLRVLEFMITMMCTEESNGRRMVLHEPSRVTPGLRALSARLRAEGLDDGGRAAETLDQAIASLSRGGDHYGIRNEMRAYKRELGDAMFRPDVLSRVINYNVAMYNQIAAEVDSSMAIDQLADELLFESQGEESRAQESGSLADPRASRDRLASPEFSRVLEALCLRVAGDESDDAAANRIVAAFDLSSLSAVEIEALEGGGDDLISDLVRKSVTLSQIIRSSREIAAELELLQLDAELLKTHSLDDLAEQMTGAARKLFADCRYDEAFELSEAKTRNLSTLGRDTAGAPARESGALGGSAGSAGSGGSGGSGGSELDGRARAGVGRQGAEANGMRPARAGRLGFDAGLSPGRFVRAIGVIACVALFALWLPDFRRDSAMSPSELAALSPFIESGERREIDGRLYFIGRFRETWAYLGTPERRTVAAEIAGRLNVAGIEDFSLSNSRREVLVAWRDGVPVDVVAKPSGR